MRKLLFVCAILCSMILHDEALAGVRIVVDRGNQSMTVSVNGEHRYSWPVSTGSRLSWTRPGRFGVNFLSRYHRSSRYNNTPMPYSIFYDGNRAIHGTTDIGRLGSRASHGCIRLHPENAATLFSLVQKNQGSTRIIVQ